MAKTHLEIERRWFLRGLPGREILLAKSTNFICYTAVYIHIGQNLEVRIQERVSYGGFNSSAKKEITFPIVTKLGHGMVRQESPKLQADKETYRYYYELRPFLPRIPVELWEVFLTGDNKKWEIKQVDWRKALRELDFTELNNVILAELEFDSEDEARAFGDDDVPSWLKPLIVKEVTDDWRYNMRNLAVYGRPCSE